MYEIIYFLHIIFNIIILVLVYIKMKKYEKIFNKIDPKRKINLELTNWKKLYYKSLTLNKIKKWKSAYF